MIIRANRSYLCAVALLAAIGVSSAALPAQALAMVSQQVARLVPGRALELPVVSGFVGDVAFGADGRVAVAFPRDPLVVVLPPRRGKAVTMGRAGEGPGEYRFPSTMFWRGDTLHVHDLQLRRLVLYDKGGRALLTDSRPQSLPSGRLLARLPNGDWLLWQLETRRSTVVGADSSAVYVLSGTPTTARRHTILRWPKSPTMLTLIGGGIGKIVQQPVSWAASVGYDPSSRQVISASTPAAPAPNGSITVQVDRHDVAGKLVRSQAFRVQSRRIDASAKSRIRDSLMTAAGIDTLANRAMRNQLTQTLYLPDFMPPIVGMLVDRAGGVWLWLRLDGLKRDSICRLPANGQPPQCALLPIGARPVAASPEGEILTREESADGESIVRTNQFSDAPGS